MEMGLGNDLGFLVLNFMRKNEVLVEFYPLELELNPSEFQLKERLKRERKPAYVIRKWSKLIIKNEL